jgi:hypothetical protein
LNDIRKGVRPVAEFDFSSYFWQGRKVRLRAFKPSDWESKYQEFIDSGTRRILECGLDLPDTPEEYNHGKHLAAQI